MQAQTPIYSQFADDPNLEYVLADYVVEHLPQRVAAVERSVRQSDWETLAQETHRLKGSSACYGFQVIANQAGEIEAACQKMPIEDQLLGMTADLVAMCRRVRVGSPGE